jgi:hypothetical protein
MNMENYRLDVEGGPLQVAGEQLRASLNGLRKNATKRRKSPLQGLKPIENTQFTSALKHRPPEEKDFFRGL